MHIDKVELENFKQYKQISVEMPDGLIGVCGPNGAGKSNFIMGLAWLLYGNDVFNESKDMIKYRLALPNDDVVGTLEFTLGEHQYCIRRSMMGKNMIASAQISCDGDIVAQKTDAVSDYVTKLLGMDWRTFYVSIYCRQKEINALGTFEPSQRRTMILQMLGIDKLDTVVSNIRQQVRVCDRELAKNKIDNNVNIKQTEHDIKTYKDASAAWDNYISNITEEIKTRTESLQQYSSYPSEYYVVQSEISALDSVIHELDNDSTNLGKEIAIANSAVEQESELVNNIRKLGRDGKCSHCTNTLGNSYESALAAAESRVSELKNQHSILCEKYNVLRADIDKKCIERSEKQQKCDDMLSNIRQFLVKANNELVDLHEKIRTATETKNDVDKTLYALTQVRNTHNSVTSMLEQKQSLAKVEDAMIKFRAHVINQISPILSYYASITINQITSGRYNNISIDDSYNIMITDDNGVEHSIKHYSGGEADLFNLALRLAISRVIIDKSGSHIKFMCLDEVLSALDTNNMAAVITTLNNCILDMDQVLIITHQGDIINMLDSKIDIVNTGDASHIAVSNA